MLASDPNTTVRVILATHHRCTSAVLARFVVDPDPRVRDDALRNPNCPPRPHRLMADAQDASVRVDAVRRQTCPDDVLRHLEHDPTQTVRAVVARHALCPRGTLKALASDPAPEVRIAVADHRFVSAATLRLLGDDPHPQVRRTVVLNMSCPHRIRSRLMSDHDPGVSGVACDHPMITMSAATRVGVWSFEWLAKHKHRWSQTYQRRCATLIR